MAMGIGQGGRNRSSDDGETNLREGTLGEDTIIEKKTRSAISPKHLSIDPSK